MLSRTPPRSLAFAVSIGFVLVSPGLAAERTGMQPWQVAMTRTVTSAQPSPDGSLIAYTLAVPRKPLVEDSGPAWVELHVSDPQGTSRPFLTGEVEVSAVRFLTDGRVGFLAKRGKDEHKALYAIRTDGGEAQRLVGYDTAISDWTVAGDARTVAFLAADPKSKEKKELEKKGFDAVIYEEDTPFVRVFLHDLEAPAETKPRKLELPGSARELGLAADGKTLFITMTPTPQIDDDYVAKRVHLVDVATARVTRVIETAGKLGAVAFSPDGAALALIAAADRNDPAAGRLMVADASSGVLREVLPELMGHASSLAWLDPQTIAYVADTGTGSAIGTVAKTGGATATLADSGTAVWSALASAGGRTVAVGNAAQHPGELFAIEGGGARRLTQSNEWLDDVAFARQETIQWRARDGLVLDGVLLHPLDYQEGRRYPLLLVVHGGPEAHVSDGWISTYSNFGQVAAARGFAVFLPNYRGSTARGVAFSKLGQADAAGPEFDDLVDAVDHLIAAGLVDRDKVGITGGSYGGYASAWATTFYSDRFAAAAPFVGISDLVSKMGTTDIPLEMFEVHHRKWLWQDWVYFLERSPIKWVERNRTPTLILHGEDDPRVHPSQSLELYRHLKLQAHAPVRLVFYPGEGHGNRKSAARLDFHLRVLQWMEHYLKGPGGAPPAYELDAAAALPWAKDDDAPASAAAPTGASP